MCKVVATFECAKLMFATPVAILSVPDGKVPEAKDFKGISGSLTRKRGNDSETFLKLIRNFLFCLATILFGTSPGEPKVYECREILAQ